MRRALVLLSGGQDSTTCLFWAKKEFNDVMAIGFDYGQKHKTEIEQAKKIADLANVDYHVLNLESAFTACSSASLLVNTLSHNEQSELDDNLPASFVGGRNIVFLSIAAALAYDNSITDIVIGTCQTDYSGYPDCRHDFIKSMEQSLSLGLDKGISLHTPLMFKTKAEIWKMAKGISEEPFVLANGTLQHLDVVEIIKKMTITDYNGNKKMNDWGMGEEDNPASKLRAKGYREAVANGWL